MLVLVPDDKGVRPVFGIPNLRRLVMLGLQAGAAPIVVATRSGAPHPALADMGSHHCNVRFSPDQSVEDIARAAGLNGDQPLLVMPADHVIDRPSFETLLAGLDNGINDPFSSNGAGTNATTIDAPADVRRAEERLVAALRFATQARDGFLARHLSRPISVRVSPLLARTRITPNAITIANGILGLIAAFLLAAGGYAAQASGGVLFLLSVIFDGVDGEVARLTLSESSFGHRLDIITDNIVHVAVFAGIGLGLYRLTNDVHYLSALALLLAGFGLCAIAVNRYFSSAEGLARTAEGLDFIKLLTNRDFAYLVALLALAGRLQWFFYATMAGTYLFASGVFLAVSWRRYRLIASQRLGTDG